MMIKKIKKYKTILERIANKKAEVKRLKRDFNNPTLNLVLNAIGKVEGNNFDDNELQGFSLLEQYRQKLNQDDRLITYEIFGSDLVLPVKDICKKGPSSETWCRFHYSLAKVLKSQHYLEIGTNLGISGGYILSAIKDVPDGKLITLEGLKKLCDIAESHFSQIADDSKFEVVQGLYDETFPYVVNQPLNFDTIFIDGNHKKEPTLHYFNTIKNKIKRQAVIVFDDINWSNEMVEAWDIIKKDEKVNYAIDLYKLGIIIIDQDDANKNVTSKLFLSL